MLRILGRASSINVRKVLWTCDELGLVYAREDWGAGYASTQSPEFLALNPNGLVPVIVDDLGPLWESTTICRYLAGRHGDGALLPAEPRARALVEQWMDWEATEIADARRYAFLALARKTPGYDDPMRIAISTQSWNARMAVLDGHLAAGGPYAAGEAFSLADVCLGLAVHRWRATPIAQAELPAVATYEALLRRRPAFGPWARTDVP
jgi:glutathione S-transferase